MGTHNVTTTMGYPTPLPNCSDIDTLPYSHVYFSTISLSEIVVISVGLVLTLTILILYLENVWFIVHYYLVQETRILSVWLLGLQPVYAVTSIIAIGIPRSALLCDLVATIYLSLCLRIFFLLMVHYHGGEETMIARMEGETINLRSPPVCCCCCCCPRIPVTKKTLSRIRICVLQVAFLRPFLVFLATVLWSDGKYVKGKMNPKGAYMYMTILTIISTFLAMYGLLLLFRASVKHLKQFHIVPKFLSVQLVLVLSNLQGIVFTILSSFNLPSCKGVLSSQARGNAMHHLLLVFEMFLLTILARFFYRRLDGSQQVTELDITYSSSVESCAKNGNLRGPDKSYAFVSCQADDKAQDNMP